MNILKRLTAVIIAGAVLLSFSACGKTEPSSYTVEKEDGALSVSADTDKRELYISRDKSKMKRIAVSDMLELYFDTENCSVSVLDTASGKLTSSLPKDNRGEKTSAVSVTVLINGNRYTLSSQSDSVGFSSALYEEKENGITVSYSFKRTLEDGTKISIYLPVTYTLAEGALTVEADCSRLIGEDHDKNIAVTDIALLPFFGSESKGSEGDYIILPDGCGLTVDLSENPEKFDGISLPVYENNNLLGAFGMKNGDSAFACLVDEGEEICTVKANKALSKSGHNRVYASFEITPVQSDGEKIYVCDESYNGKLRTVYRFLSYGNADYIGMAGAIRELLIRKGCLLSATAEEKGVYPFNLSVVFRDSITDSKGKVFSSNLTTYTQAQEIIDSLKAKGIGNINMRLKGIIDDKGIGYGEYSVKPGKSGELDSLLASGDGDTVSFYTDAAIVSELPDKSAEFFAVRPDGGVVTDGNRAFVSVERIDKNTNALLSLMRKNPVQGVCINDVASHLYGDFAVGKLHFKTDTADIISKQLGSVSASGRLMVDTGNIYAVKYASAVVNLPSSAKLQGRELCARVPFIQTVLHGITDYSCEPINKSENSEKAFLRSIEYGAVPYYEWYGSDFSAEEKTDKSNYMNFITEAQNQYERASAAFSDLRDARITDHYKVKKNVYYTCYDNSAGIYVNYNTKAVSVNGVTVDAMSFLRVN